MDVSAKTLFFFSSDGYACQTFESNYRRHYVVTVALFYDLVTLTYIYSPVTVIFYVELINSKVRFSAEQRINLA